MFMNGAKLTQKPDIYLVNDLLQIGITHIYTKDHNVHYVIENLTNHNRYPYGIHSVRFCNLLSAIADNIDNKYFQDILDKTNTREFFLPIVTEFFVNNKSEKGTRVYYTKNVFDNYYYFDYVYKLNVGEFVVITQNQFISMIHLVMNNVNMFKTIHFNSIDTSDYGVYTEPLHKITVKRDPFDYDMSDSYDSIEKENPINVISRDEFIKIVNNPMLIKY